MMSSVIKLAALVDLIEGGGEESLSLCPQACLNGDGFAGAVALAGRPVVRRRGGILFGFLAKDVPLIAGLAPFETGNGSPRACSVDVKGAIAGAAIRFVEADATGTVEEDDNPTPSLSRRFLVSINVMSGGDNFIRAPDGRDEPKAGDRYRLRGRALPAPSHR